MTDLVCTSEEPMAAPAGGETELEALRARVRDKNINEVTLLATDYLNHFNEIIMLFELLPDMPDMLEEAQAWEPKSYAQHFKDSCFAEKDLAILAYDNAPARYRVPFDRTVQHLDDLVADAMDGLVSAIEADDLQRLSVTAERVTGNLRRFVDVASGIIHGQERTMDQDEIDAILGTA